MQLTSVKTVFVLSVLSAAVLPCFADEVTLANGGEAKAEIVVADIPVTAVQFAALELREHLKAMTGADFAIVSEGERTADKYPIYIGASSAVEYRTEDLKEQEIVIDVDKKRTVLFGLDNLSTNKVRIAYDGGPGAIGGMWNEPGIWTDRGSLNATYGFLHDNLGVRWLDCTEAGTFVPSKPDLSVSTGVWHDCPFTRCRDVEIEPFEWDRRRSPEEWARHMRTAYPLADKERPLADKGNQHHWNCRNWRINKNKQLFGLRMRTGGHRLAANHSFYHYYQKFWDPGSKLFVESKPQYFSKHHKRVSRGRGQPDEVFAEFDTERKPSQLCFSNKELFDEVVKEIRAYFDIGGYTNSFANQGIACSAEHPFPKWGKDTYCIEPMDNGAFCECDECMKQYRPDLPKEQAAKYSDYWFGFVNKVAREIKKSHPDKFIATLAYGGGREGLPSFRLEDNVVVHFCWSGNRHPNAVKQNIRQKGLVETWRKAYPGKPFGIWLYNGFPHESGTWYGYLPVPGFFGKMFDEQMKYLRDIDVKECIFNCGLKDDFELFLGCRLMWNPNEKYEDLKKEFFSSFGPAEKAVTEFYDVVEERHCNPSYCGDYQGHLNRNITCTKIITGDVMKRLVEIMAEGEKAIESGTPWEKARFTNWKSGYWDYLKAVKMHSFQLPAPKEGVTLTRTECYGGGEVELGGEDLLSGHPVKVFYADNTNNIPIFYFGKKQQQAPELTDMTNPNKFFDGFFNGGNPTGIVLRCNARIKDLSRFRFICTDGLRNRYFFDLVGWKGNEKITLIENILIDKPFQYSGLCYYDFDFTKDSVPADLDAIGIVDRYYEAKGKFYSPRYYRLSALSR